MFLGVGGPMSCSVPFIDPGAGATASAIRDTTSWESPRSLEQLPAFLEAFSEDAKKLGHAAKENGSPHTIIVAAAGLRAADVVRYVSTNRPLIFLTHRAITFRRVAMQV